LEAYEITWLPSLCPRHFGLVSYAIRVISKERSWLVLPQSSGYIVHPCFLGSAVIIVVFYIVTISVVLCGLVVRVSGYSRRGPGSIPGATRFFWVPVGLEPGTLSLVSINEELLERKSGSGLGNQDKLPWGFRRSDHATPL
jgi:hypothetical protein